MNLKKRVTKMTLGDIPRANTPKRLLMMLLTNQDQYKEAVDNGIPGFMENELSVIEEKYKKRGMSMEDIQMELKRKGWLVKPNTIKHYIQKEQLPRPKVARKKTFKGAVSIYPANFMRHLNFVRFWLNVGRSKFEEMWNSLLELFNGTVNDQLNKHTDEGCFSEYDNGFIHAIYVGLSDIDNGLFYGKKAIESAFSDDKKNKEKYLVLLNEIRKAAEVLEKKAKFFKVTAEGQKIELFDENKFTES